MCDIRVMCGNDGHFADLLTLQENPFPEKAAPVPVKCQYQSP